MTDELKCHACGKKVNPEYYCYKIGIFRVKWYHGICYEDKVHDAKWRNPRRVW